MRRETELVRELVLKLEAMDDDPTFVLNLMPSTDPDLVCEKYSKDQVLYHLMLLRDAGYTNSPGDQPLDGITFQGLTWAGHDFADAVRDPEIWAKTKEGALKAGGWTVDLLKDLAIGFIKQQVKARTGVEL